MRRTEQREHIFKLLFVSEFNTPEEMPEQLQLYFEGIETGEKTPEDEQYIAGKYQMVKDSLGDIDRLINAVSKGWKTARMNKVDLSVLRLAVYEMLYDQDIPSGVAINEAVEIAKRFGGEASGSFVNGILGKIASQNAGAKAPEAEKTTAEEVTDHE